MSSQLNGALRSRTRFLRGALGAIVAAGPVAAAARPASAIDSYTLRLSLATSATTAWNISAMQWADNVSKHSKGRLKIESYPNSQLAKEQESIEGLLTGDVDLAFQQSTFLEPLFPKMQVFSLPFMFKNAAAALRVVDGPVGDEMFADFKTKGILGLFWGFTGFREFWTSGKSITNVEDMKGLRFRIQGGAVNAAMVQALGALPLTIDFSEMRSALVQHTIDVVDSTLVSAASNKLYSVVNHVAMTNHIFSLQPLLASKRKIDALPPDLQKLMKDEVRAIVPSWRASTTLGATDSINFLKTQGMIFSDINYPAFRKAMDPVYASLSTKIGADVVQRVSRLANPV